MFWERIGQGLCEVVWRMMHYLKSGQIRSFFWSISFRIWTEYEDLRTKSSYSLRKWENTDQKNPRIWTLFTQWWLSSKNLWTEADPEYVLFVEWRSRDFWRNCIPFMKYESMKEVSHGFCKKYKILQYKNWYLLWSRWIFQVISAASSGPL